MEDLCQSEINKKIPIRISWIKNKDGFHEPEISIDIEDFCEFEGSISDAIVEFKKQYFEIVKKVQEIMPKNKTERKASHFWKVGKLLFDFNKSITNEFEITNYTQAIIRDFGLYDRSHVGHTLQFGEFFNEKDILDSIPMSTYLELIWKANLLKKRGILEKEKKRLLKRAKNKTLPPHKEYRVELNELTKPIKE